MDVRDVAQAHINAITIPEAAGNRFMLVSGSYWFKEISDWLRESHGKYYKRIPKSHISYFKVSIGALYYENAKFAKANWKKELTFDNSKTKELLQIPFRDMRGSVQEMA